MKFPQIGTRKRCGLLATIEGNEFKRLGNVFRELEKTHRKGIHMKLRTVLPLILSLFFIAAAPTMAQTTAPSPPQVKIPTAVVQAVNTINSAMPGLNASISGIQQAQATGDPAAVVQATGNAISQATAAASVVPTPASPYLALASFITAFATPLIAGLFGLFMHKSNQAAHATAQAAIAGNSSPK